MSDRTETVRIDLTSCEPTTGKATLVENAPPTRFMRAAVITGACWAVALACVFIPLLHFVLVPTFVALGAILGVLRLREDVTLATVEGACPKCRTERTFVVGGRFTDGRAVHCDGCGNKFTVHMTSALPAAPLSP
jgi:hypothetical protein